MSISRTMASAVLALSLGVVSGPVLAKAADGKSAKAVEASQVKNAKVNINKADVGALEAVKGIGFSKAQAIVDYRVKHGAFKSLDDLVNVRGIGEKFLDRIRGQLTV